MTTHAQTLQADIEQALADVVDVCIGYRRLSPRDQDSLMRALRQTLLDWAEEHEPHEPDTF